MSADCMATIHGYQTDIELSTIGSPGAVQSDELEAEEVVTVLDALRDCHALDAAVRDLRQCY